MRKESYSLPVYSTEDYSVFSTLTGNRDIYPLHVRRLVKVIKKNPEFTKRNPIKVTKDLEIIDGQHRVEAYKQYAGSGAGTPSVYYIIQEGGLEEARDLNAGSKAWVPKDYAKAYASDGNPHYKDYLTEVSAFPNIPHTVVARYLGGAEDSMKEFKHGGFVVKDIKTARVMLKQLDDLLVLYRGGKGGTQSFGLAFWPLGNAPLYDHDRMVEQLSKYKDALNSIPVRVSEIRAALNMVYNFRNPQKVDLLSE